MMSPDNFINSAGQYYKNRLAILEKEINKTEDEYLKRELTGRIHEINFVIAFLKQRELPNGIKYGEGSYLPKQG